MQHDEHRPPPSIRRRVVAVTGANRGLGEALVLEGLAAGWEIAACVRDGGRSSPRWRGDARVHVIDGDLADESSVRQLAARLGEFEDLFGLVNNAALQHAYPVLEGAAFEHALAEELAVNLASPVALGHALMPLLARNTGFVANLSSGLAYVPKARSPVYCATKAALSHYTRSARLQCPGVRLVEVVLPLVDTDMTRGRGGSGKLPPELAARRIVRGLVRGEDTIRVGKARWLPLLLRLLPEAWVTGAMNRGDGERRHALASGD